MRSASLFVAASSIASLALGAPIAFRRAGASYQVFGGDGTKGQGWPLSSQWLSFSQLWDINLPTLQASCSQYEGSPQNNSPAENEIIKNALQSTAKEINVDPRFLLAVMMQESKGCARAPTTNYGEVNPGLFQSFNGQWSCNRNGDFYCNQTMIEGMIREGAGINLDFGLQQAIAQSGASDDSKYYKGARIYNSGSLPASGNLGDGIATHCYSSDIANRLVGWDSNPSSCQEASIGSVQGSATAFTGGNTGNTDNNDNYENNNNNNNNPEPQPQPQPQENEANTQEPPKDEQEKKPETPAPGNNDSSAPKIQGADPNCKSWYTVKEGDDCSKLSVSFETLRRFNSQLDDKCTNLWKGYAYCVDA